MVPPTPVSSAAFPPVSHVELEQPWKGWQARGVASDRRLRVYLHTILPLLIVAGVGVLIFLIG